MDYLTVKVQALNPLTNNSYTLFSALVLHQKDERPFDLIDTFLACPTT